MLQRVPKMQVKALAGNMLPARVSPEDKHTMLKDGSQKQPPTCQQLSCFTINQHPQQLSQLPHAEVAAAAAGHCCQDLTCVTVDQGLMQAVQFDQHVNQAGQH